MTARPRPTRTVRSRRAGRVRWPAVALLAAVLVLIGVTAPAAVTPAAATTPGGGGARVVQPVVRTEATPSTTEAPSPLMVTVTEVIPLAANSDTVTVRGTLATTSADTLTNLWMSLSIGSSRVGSREGLTSLATSAAAASRQKYLRLQLSGGGDVQPVTAIPVRSGGPVGFEITAQLGSAGQVERASAYPLRVQVSGSRSGRTAETLGAAYSFVVRPPAGPQQPTEVTVVLPIADQPRLRSDGLLTDNLLDEQIRPGGRLAKLLDAAHAPVILAVDPTLVQALRVMSRPEGYAYASPANPTGGIHVPASSYAAGFLVRLARYARDGGTLIALPYGDADLTALVHAQKLDTVRYAVKTGQVVLDELVPGAPSPVAYPADGLADATTVDVLRQLEVGTVLLDDRLLPAPPSLTYTPSAGVNIATSAGGAIRVLTTDHRLAAAATAYTGVVGGPSPGSVLARFRADLAVIAAERPEVRHLVLALPRDWQVPDDWAGQLLGAVNSDVSTSAPLDDLLGTDRPSAPRGGLVYPADAQARELPTTYLDSVSNVQEEAQALQPVLCAPPRNTLTCRLRLVDPMTNALVTATSVWWRGDRMSDGVLLSQQVDGDVTAIREGIQVVASRSVNLTSRHGLVPITLENNTAHDVTVVLAISSTNTSRLRSPQRETRALPPGQKAQIEIEVDAEGARTFPLEIRRLNVDGKPLSSAPPKLILVRLTVYGTIATAITVIAVSVLLLAVVFRLVRRLRRGASRPLAAGPPTPANRTPDASQPPLTGPIPERTAPSARDSAAAGRHRWNGP